MPEPVLPASLVLAIGRVTVNGTRLEFDVTMMLWNSLGHAGLVSFPTTQKFAPPPSDFANVIKSLRAVGASRFSGGLAAAFTRVLDEAKRLQGLRHDVVHGLWLADPDSRGRHLVVTVRKVEHRMSVKAVDDLASSIHRCRGELLKLMPAIQSAIPDGDDRIREVAPDNLRGFADAPGALGTAGETPLRAP